MSRIRSLVCVLRLLAQSCAIEEENAREEKGSITVRWVEGMESVRPSVSLPPAARSKKASLGRLTYCRYQANPKDPRYVPNHWENRAERADPSPNRASLEFMLEKPESTGVPRFRNYNLDIEGILHSSYFNPAPRRPAFQTWQTLFEMDEDGKLNPERMCRNCDEWEKIPTSHNSWRPPGPMTRDACNGCIVSFLDQADEEEREERLRAYEQWVEAREQVVHLEATKLDAQSPAQKKAWVRKKAEADQALAEAANDCKALGVKVGHQRWSPTNHIGEQPSRPLEASVVTANFRRVWR